MMIYRISPDEPQRRGRKRAENRQGKGESGSEGKGPDTKNRDNDKTKDRTEVRKASPGDLVPS